MRYSVSVNIDGNTFPGNQPEYWPEAIHLAALKSGYNNHTIATILQSHQTPDGNSWNPAQGSQTYVVPFAYDPDTGRGGPSDDGAAVWIEPLERIGPFDRASADQRALDLSTTDDRVISVMRWPGGGYSVTLETITDPHLRIVSNFEDGEALYRESL